MELQLHLDLQPQLVSLGALLNKTDAALPTVGAISKVQFSFSESGFVKTDALVFANTEMYESVDPSAFAAAS
jgi:hypothetical protein